jgi:hypothetical protein
LDRTHDFFKPIGWYMIAGWGRTRQTWKITLTKPEGMSDEAWNDFCDEMIRDFEERERLESQEDWAYGDGEE